MTGSFDFLDKGDFPFPKERDVKNPVHEARKQLGEALAADPFGKANPGLRSALAPIIEAVGWNGTTRDIFEAMPHQGEIVDIATLRTVLLRLNIRTIPVDVDSRHLLESHCPCLVAVDDRCMLMVSKGEKGEWLRAFDSASGSWRIIDRNRLTGQVYRFENALAEERNVNPSGKSWVIAALMKFRPRITTILWQSFAINLLGLSISIYMMIVYDKAIRTYSVDTLAWLGLGVLIAVGCELRLRHNRGQEIARLGARFDGAVTTAAYRVVIGLPLKMTETASLGSQLMRFRQFEIGRELFSGSLAASMLDLPFTILFFIVIFTLGSMLGFITLGLAVLLAAMAILSKPVLAAQGRETGEWKTKTDALLVEVATKLSTIRSSGAEEIWRERTGEAYRHYLMHRFHNLQFNGTLQTVAQAAATIAGALTLGIGALKVMDNTLTMGALIAIMAVVWRVLAPIQIVFLSLHRISQLLATARQIDQLMKMKTEHEPGRHLAFVRGFKGEISASGISFRHGQQDLTLKNLSLDIKAGEFVTVTGPSGAGKSTLMKVLLGLYVPQGGMLRLDGLDIRQLDPAEIRKTISYVGQDAVLFYGTIAQNLRLAAPEASEGQLLRALESVGIVLPHPAFNEGLDTRFNPALQQKLSSALRQRLILARAFVSERQILLLDEPATYLDRMGDEILMGKLLGLKGRSTILMVTSRPSHMRLSDRVVYMAEGQIAADGPPEKIVPAILAQTKKPAA